MLVLSATLLAACGGATPEESGSATEPPARENPHPAGGTAAATRDYEIVTLLPKDAIPSIDSPEFYLARQADQEYDAQELVLGVVFDGQARAYSLNMLSRHEIVNDEVAGHPIAITW
jgi:hypothetical protein